MFVQQCVVFLVTLQVSSAVQHCQTPNSQDGDCKIITDCPILYQVLLRKPAYNSTRANYLRKSNCGFEGRLPKVCCPIGSVLPPTTTTTPVDTTETVYVIKSSKSLLPGLNECGTYQYSDPRIIKEDTSLGDVPWMALLEYESPNGKKKVLCGGALISKRYVLTAAHCIRRKDLPKTWKLVSVRLGDHDIETDPDCATYNFGTKCAPLAISVEVEEGIVHESFNSSDKNQYHDIALLRLKQEVNFTDYVVPVCLPTTTKDLDNPTVGKQFWLSGWGVTSNGTNSPTKLQVRVPVKEIGRCQDKYRINLGDGQMCAGGQQKDSCHGDSGGPLMDYGNEGYFYVAGVQSFGPSPCEVEGWPVVYTRVSPYRKWITGQLKQ